MTVVMAVAVAVQLPGVSRTGEEAVDELAPPQLPLSCPFMQPGKKKVSFNVPKKAQCPPLSIPSVAAQNRDVSCNTTIKNNGFEAFLPQVK